jgi:hypothetical protein
MEPVALASQLPAADRTDRAWSAGFAVRLGVVTSIFVSLLMVGIQTLDKAIRHADYFYSFHDSTSFGTWTSPPPTLGDAGWAFLLGPGMQLALFGLLSRLMVRRRPSWVRRLRAITWWMLALDGVVLVVILGMAQAAII